jgi:hypothetical protein
MSEYELKITHDELILLHNLCRGHMEYIIRDVSKLSLTGGTEDIRLFYVGMLIECHQLAIKIISLIKH